MVDPANNNADQDAPSSAASPSSPSRSSSSRSSGETIKAQAPPSSRRTPEQQRKRRNLAIGLMVIGFVILIYLVTILRLSASIA